MSKQVLLHIVGLPPSVNHYVKHSRGRHYKTKEAEQFEWDVNIAARSIKEPLEQKGPYSVQILLSMGPKKKGDIDNFCKVVLDSLVKAGVIHSDSSVEQLSVRKFRGEESFTNIVVSRIRSGMEGVTWKQ